LDVKKGGWTVKRTMAKATIDGVEMEMQAVADGFATVDQVAKFLSLSRATIYALMNDGSLPSAKMGKSRRLPWSAVKAYGARAMLSP
jgi:excisionase family DNA binding protein